MRRFVCLAVVALALVLAALAILGGVGLLKVRSMLAW